MFADRSSGCTLWGGCDTTTPCMRAHATRPPEVLHTCNISVSVLRHTTPWTPDPEPDHRPRCTNCGLCKPLTLHPTPYTLHPTPYTLHPTPYTLHPTPYTLHPTPYTLHPTSYTLHPAPYTPHFTPYTLLPTRCTLLTSVQAVVRARRVADVQHDRPHAVVCVDQGHARLHLSV